MQVVKLNAYMLQQPFFYGVLGPVTWSSREGANNFSHIHVSGPAGDFHSYTLYTSLVPYSTPL